MQKWYIIIGIFLISIGCKPKGPPRIMFYETEFNFGAVYQDETFTHIFEFKNVGGDTLMIEYVVVTCKKCTHAEILSDSKIAPNQKGQIALTFYSKEFKGEIEKTIYVHSNDPTNPRFPLKIKATVVNPSQ